MSFPIDGTIPAGPNDPADDQPKMQANFANIKGYLTVDHVLPGAVGDGFHKQITYNNMNPPGVIVDPITVSYTNVGIVDPTHPQLYWKNSQGIFPESALRAFGVFTADAGVATIITSFNVATITAAVLVYTITLTANSTYNVGDKVVVLVSLEKNPGGSFGYTTTITGGVITITLLNALLVVPMRINFAVLQI